MRALLSPFFFLFFLVQVILLKKTTTTLCGSRSTSKIFKLHMMIPIIYITFLPLTTKSKISLLA